MDDQRLGSVLRALRIRRFLTHEQVARRAHVSGSTVSRVERGHLAGVSIGTLRAVSAVLEVRVGIAPAWRGGDLERVLNAGHAAMHERVIQLLDTIPGWQFASEVSFSIFGERGVIDVLAFHLRQSIVLVIDLNTEVVDGQGLVATMDRRRRLALQIAAERGWAAERVATWVVVAEPRSNRRRLARQAMLLRHAFPADGRPMRAWLQRPRTAISALSFLPETEILTNGHGRRVRHAFGLPKRVALRPPGSPGRLIGSRS